jgi:hypothetical protein
VEQTLPEGEPYKYPQCPDCLHHRHNPKTCPHTTALVASMREMLSSWQNTTPLN